MPEKKDTRTLRERMKGRTADLDAAIDGPAPPKKADADTDRRKQNQSTDKNNSGY